MSRKLKVTLFTLTIIFFSYFFYSNIFIVPYHHLAFVKDKVHGWDNKSYKAGYYWFWQGFIPKQLNFHLVNLVVQTNNIHLMLELPYAKFLNLPEAFLIQMKCRVSYELNTHFIKQQITNNISKTNNIYHNITFKIETIFRNKIQEIITNNNNLLQLKSEIKKFINDQEELKRLFTKNGLIFKQVSNSFIHIPKEDLYKEYIKNLQLFINAHQNASIQKIKNNITLNAQEQKNAIEIKKLKEIISLIKDESQILQYIKYLYLNPKANTIIIDESSDGLFNQKSSEVSAKTKPIKNSHKKKPTIFKKIKNFFSTGSFTNEKTNSNNKPSQTSTKETEIERLTPFEKK